jgi:hypothetical protein
MYLALEVLDKSPTPLQHWAWGIAIGACGFITCKRWPRAAVLVLAILLAYTWGAIGLYTDEFVGPAVWREGGYPYLFHVAGSTLIALILPALGFYMARREMRGRIRDAG